MTDLMFGQRPPRKAGMLGKKPRRHDPRTILLADYVPAGAPPIPPAVKHWEGKIAFWPMMKNDTVGDCVIAAAGHEVMLWTAYDGDEFIASDGQIIADYSAITGYNPADPSTDQGTVMLDALNYRRNVGMLGRKILGYAAVNLSNQEQVCQAIYLFIGVDAGFDFPAVAMDQFNAGQPWDVVANDGGIQGGHCVYIVGYDSQYLYCITWGHVQKMTWAFFMKYFTEVYAVLSPDIFNNKGVTPVGFGVQELLADLGLMGKRK
jgi:hypothetical protein